MRVGTALAIMQKFVRGTLAEVQGTRICHVRLRESATN
jgi:hypothetical protein